MLKTFQIHTMASFEHAVTRSLQCPICLDLMTEPKLLSCSHTFCKKCLTDLLASKAGSNSLTCPVCRSETEVENGDVSNLKTNIPLKSLIADVKDKGALCEVCETESLAVFYCCDCEHNMCGKCHEQHGKWKPHKNHKVVNVSDIRQGKVVLKKKVLCKNHDQGVENESTDVCITCKKFICLRCRMLDHEKKGHDVQSLEEYNASSTKKIESLLNEADIKTKTIDKYIVFVDREREKDIKHIEGVQAEADTVYQEELKQLNERKTLIDKKCNDEKEWIGRKFDKFQVEGKNQQACIKSACELATKSSKTPLDGDTVAIRESLCAELKSVLSQKDPDNSIVNDTSKHVQTLKFEQAPGVNELVLGSVEYKKWTKEDVALPTKNSMNCIIPLKTGEMAVGCKNGKIEIISSVGELLNTVKYERGIQMMACLTNRRYAILDGTNSICILTSDWNKLPLAFETMNKQEAGSGYIAVDTRDSVYVSYRKFKKIQIFSVSGGKAMKEISCNDYEPCIIHAMKSEGFLLVSNTWSVRVINDQGEVKYNLDQEGERNAYPSVCHDGSVIVAWIDSNSFLVTIKHYTDQLVHKSTLISDFKIEKPEREWYQLQEFLSGDIAFCTTDRLYIFHK